MAGKNLLRALSARPDFWEAAADRELKRFLDWWQAGLRRPDYDIPLVRSTLADELRRTGSIRQLQRTIVTSLPPSRDCARISSAVATDSSAFMPARPVAPVFATRA